VLLNPSFHHKRPVHDREKKKRRKKEKEKTKTER
jgi:hypothetical protein